MKKLNILVACECSGKVRSAFRALGHNAYSCDIQPDDKDANHPFHFRMDLMQVLNKKRWDLIVAFPPCTHLSASGARWWADKEQEQKEAIAFVQTIMNADCDHIAIENPVGKLSTAIRKPDQYIQPWQHGHGETKKTGLWLKGLPLITPTNIVEGRSDRIHKMAPGPNRAKLRSETYDGIANAIATQWSDHLLSI